MSQGRPRRPRSQSAPRRRPEAAVAPAKPARSSELPARAESIQDCVREVRARIERIRPAGKVALGASQRLVADSAYWYGHPQGGPAKAPKHADRITWGTHGWEVEFGGNTFLVGLAIRRCCESVERSLAAAEREGVKQTAPRLRAELERVVRGSVANHVGEEYGMLWGTSSGHMLLGNQSIHVGEFVNGVWTYLRLDRVTQG